MRDIQKKSVRLWMKRMEALRPGDADELHQFVRVVLGVDVPRKAVVEGHSSPFEYLIATFFEPPEPPEPPEGPPALEDEIQDARSLTPPESPPDPEVAARCGSEVGRCAEAHPTTDGTTHTAVLLRGHAVWHPAGPDLQLPGGDLVVWANRGGGKTFLGAVATALDLLFKPGVQVRILAGSVEQAGKMYGYLLKLLRRPGVRRLVEGEPTQRRVELINGSGVEVLAASERSVRGVRVHKLRCDEVELFKSEIWEAAQRVTQSGWCGGVYVRGRVEAMSTMHRPFGLMSRLVPGRTNGGLGSVGAGGQAASGARRVFKWGVIDVMERCPPGRDCGACPLWEDCGGLAKGAQGFVAIDDVIAQKGRSSREAWESEMMCQRPRRSDCVYANFTAEGHGSLRGDGLRQSAAMSSVAARGVRQSERQVDDLPYGEVRTADATVGGFGGHVGEVVVREGDVVVGGMDFGWRSPFVMVWARVGEGDVVEVFDEYVRTGRTLEEHMRAVGGRGWPRLAWVGVDPAGAGANSQTGMSDVAVLRGAGYVVRWAREGVRGGIERVRRRLDQGRLRIDGRCVRLIEAMSTYHFDAQRPWSEEPVKDGPDHLCDALRYLVVNLEAGAGGKVVVRRWV